MPGTNGHSRLDDNEELQEQQQPQQPKPETSIMDNTLTPPTEGGVSAYDDIIGDIETELAEMKRKRREEEKIDATVAAINGIGELGSALGNIYATTNYAPSSFNPNSGMSAKFAERAEKAKAQYDRNRETMMNYLWNVKKAKHGESLAREKFDFEKKKAADKAEREQALTNAKVESYNAMTKYREAIANKNDALAKKYEEDVVYLQAKTRYLELGYNLKQAETQARIDANEALADKRRRESGAKTTTTTTTETTTRHEGDGGSGGKGKGYGTDNGKGRGY